MSEKEVMKRFRYKNPELLNDLHSRGKSVILVFGHYGNWEYLAGLQKFIKHKTLGVYKPLHIRYFDQMFIKSRERFGMQAVSIDKIPRLLAEYRKSNTLNISYFAADQRTLLKNSQYWTTFFNQDTPVVLGPEKLAKKLDSAVVFLKISRIKRGYYESTFTLITDEPAKTANFEITDIFLHLLEDQITEAPFYWLWTHDRWKHKKTDFDRIYGSRAS
jgi:KDO2-lipid IV(A) lauroyltransferase